MGNGNRFYMVLYMVLYGFRMENIWINIWIDIGYIWFLNGNISVLGGFIMKYG